MDGASMKRGLYLILAILIGLCGVSIFTIPTQHRMVKEQMFRKEVLSHFSSLIDSIINASSKEGEPIQFNDYFFLFNKLTNERGTKFYLIKGDLLIYDPKTDYFYFSSEPGTQRFSTYPDKQRLAELLNPKNEIGGMLDDRITSQSNTGF